MSDTITVREQCPHGQYEQHLLYTAIHHTIPDVVCPGGREIVLRPHDIIYVEVTK